jgi:alanine-glyoxylate transaminase/(R)-3-amino-2-methylpropionate-pyruvate transaminase
MKSIPLPPCDFQPAPYAGPSAVEVLALRREFLSPSLFHYYREPLMIVEGKGCWLFDEAGRRYLDALGGIATVSVGHAHPDIVAAARRQQALIQHTTTVYLNPEIALYARELAARMPGELKVVMFVNSGSEANDLALLLARAATGNFDAIALRNGYHGGSSATMGLTSQHTWKFNVPQTFGVHHARMPDTYRGPWGRDDADAGRKYADDVRDLIAFGTSGRIAAFFAESVQGVGGAVPLPAGYLENVYAHVRAAGGLCIADEVQAGFARTGDHFWGFEAQGVVPDIVTLAKGIGNGMPLGAVVTTPAIAAALAARHHFNTFGGNPVACAQGRAVLEVIARERLQENARVMGARIRAGFERLAAKHALIGDIRGAGLLIGLELVKDRRTKEPAVAECAAVFERSRQLGLLAGKSGLWGNTLRFTPPLCIGAAEADFLVAVIDEALGAA